MGGGWKPECIVRYAPIIIIIGSWRESRASWASLDLLKVRGSGSREFWRRASKSVPIVPGVEGAAERQFGTVGALVTFKCSDLFPTMHLCNYASAECVRFAGSVVSHRQVMFHASTD